MVTVYLRESAALANFHIFLTSRFTEPASDFLGTFAKFFFQTTIVFLEIYSCFSFIVRRLVIDLSAAELHYVDMDAESEMGGGLP